MKTRYVKSRVSKGQSAKEQPVEKKPSLTSELSQKQPAEEQPPKKRLFAKRPPKSEAADAQTSEDKPPRKRLFKKRTKKAEAADAQPSEDKPPKKRLFKKRTKKAEAADAQPSEDKPPRNRFFKKRTKKAEAADAQPSGEKPPRKRLFKKRAEKAETTDAQISENKPPKKRLFKKRASTMKPVKERFSKRKFLKFLSILVPCAVLITGLGLAAFSMANRSTYSPPSYTPPVIEEPKEREPEQVKEEKAEEREVPPQGLQIPEKINPPAESGDSPPNQSDTPYDFRPDSYEPPLPPSLQPEEQPLPPSPQPEEPPIDEASIQEELDLLSENRPTLLIDCTFCGGSGNSSTPCKRCDGKGTILLGTDMFRAFVDCSRCRGDKYEPCDHCTFGLMNDPDFETKIAEWHEKRHTLWKKLGYSDEEISQMEMDEAKLALDERKESITISPSVPDSGPSISGGDKRICRVCNTTGKCPTCNGARRYINPFTGEFQTCKSCTNGNCRNCGGTGWL